MPKFFGIVVSALMLAGTGSVFAADQVSRPTVVELFTSQGCYSCPPAEAHLGRLAKRKDVVALEFHVDYWDDLVYGLAGKWKDPFSDRKYTERQRDYNVAIRRKTGVYTPQMVIAGTLETVGSYEDQVEKAIEVIGEANVSPLNVQVGGDGKTELKVRVDGNILEPASVWLVHFHRNVETKVRSGENKGKTLVSHNIVTGMERIGEWRGESLSLDVMRAASRGAQGCAVIVQRAPAGPILGARYCPNAQSS